MKQTPVVFPYPGFHDRSGDNAEGAPVLISPDAAAPDFHGVPLLLASHAGHREQPESVVGRRHGAWAQDTREDRRHGRCKPYGRKQIEVLDTTRSEPRNLRWLGGPSACRSPRPKDPRSSQSDGTWHVSADESPPLGTEAPRCFVAPCGRRLQYWLHTTAGPPALHPEGPWRGPGPDFM